MDDGIKSRIVSGIRCLYKDRYLAVEPWVKQLKLRCLKW
jgi:hypothetical protein